MFCRRVKVDVASHSPQVDLLREDLLAALAGVAAAAGSSDALDGDGRSAKAN